VEWKLALPTGLTGFRCPLEKGRKRTFSWMICVDFAAIV